MSTTGLDGEEAEDGKEWPGVYPKREPTIGVVGGGKSKHIHTKNNNKNKKKKH